jgi:hypothetical protein
VERDAALMPTTVRFRQVKIPHLWSKRDSAQTALDTIALIKRRIYQGIDDDGVKFDGYSTKAIYVAKKGARLSPKGGRPSSTGKSVYYKGGYKQYKHESRRRVQGGSNQTAEVDLTLSGALINNIVPTSVKREAFSIGLSPAVRHYGYYVDDRRGFIGLTDREVVILSNAIAARIRKKLR